MSQPPAYARSNDFADDERLNRGGRSTVSTAALNAEFDAVSATLAGVRTNIALNQRDDGEIRDGRVKLHTLAADVLALVAASGGVLRGAWTTDTTYALKDVVVQTNTYMCAAVHVSGTFATDLAAGKWVLLSLGGNPAASTIPFTATTTLSATNVQAAIEESDSENRSAIASGDATILATLASQADATMGTARVGHIPAETNAVPGTVQRFLRRYKPLTAWMSSSLEALVRSRGPFDATTRGQLLTAVTNAWTDALAFRHDLFGPAGLYELAETYFPWRNTSSSSLLDAQDITLWCEGPQTEFRTVSTAGADVFQCNAIKNFHVRGFPKLSASVTGSTSGSNGVSITNGGDNLDFEIYGYQLPGLDKGALVDGGKAFTIQPGTSSNELGRIWAHVIADGCSEGFGYEPDLLSSLTKKASIDVNLQARNCYIGAKIVANGASGALSTNMHSGVSVRGQVVDCQKGIVIQRIHGLTADLDVMTTKTAAARRLNPDGVTWFAANTVVESVLVQYAHNARLHVQGNAGATDYKARIGAADPGSSGLIGATKDCFIRLDIGGTSSLADVQDLDFGGNTLLNSLLHVSNRTATTLPDAFHAGALKNDLKVGSVYGGSFVGTLTGCTTTPTATFQWTLDNDEVTLRLTADLLATSNTTNCTITGLPAALQPAQPQIVGGARAQNNGVDAISFIDITAGTLTLYFGATLTFTNTGTKGLKQCTFKYRKS